MQNFLKLLSLWKWSSIDDNLYDWAIMVFNFLLYIFIYFQIFCFILIFIRCIKLEENFENLLCEKLCQVKVAKFLSADENLYRSFFFFFFCRRIFFTDEYFSATNWHEGFDTKFESKLLWNDFSCRSKVWGNLTAKSDYEFTVKGIQIIQKNNKWKGCISNAAKMKFLIKNEHFYINQIFWLFWKYCNTPLITW